MVRGALASPSQSSRPGRWAGRRAAPLVVALHVVAEARGAREERSRAQGARVRPLARVRALVRHEVAALAERERAHVAREGPLARVQAHVVHHVTARREPRPARGASERPVRLVIRQPMPRHGDGGCNKEHGEGHHQREHGQGGGQTKRTYLHQKLQTAKKHHGSSLREEKLEPPVENLKLSFITIHYNSLNTWPLIKTGLPLN